MTGRDAFAVWAPAGARWADWARPVAFVAPPEAPEHIAANPSMPATNAAPGIFYTGAADAARGSLAIVADLPGAAGVWEGIALAGLGFRPVPLYNGTNAPPGAMALVDNTALQRALLAGAAELQKITIPKNAPPAFLLDSNRTHRHKMDASVFDNSWDVYGQDMPSAEYLLAGGIRGVAVRGGAIAKDLARILYQYQKKGVAILFTDGLRPPKALRLRKPPRESG